MKLAAVTVAALAALFAAVVASHGQHPAYDGCTRAFKTCNFRFQYNRYSVPTFHISAEADKAFTPRIVWKDSSKRIGIVNANREGRFIAPSGSSISLSNVSTGGQHFTPYQFKPYTIMRKQYGVKYPVATPYSGIGHEVFQGNVDAAKGKCVKVMITHYQTLTSAHPPTVSGNVNDAHDCVVFRTA